MIVEKLLSDNSKDNLIKSISKFLFAQNTFILFEEGLLEVFCFAYVISHIL